MKDQPGTVYFFVPLNVYCLGIVDCNSIEDHLHTYMYLKVEGGKGGIKVAILIMTYLSDKGYLNGTTQLDLSIIMDNCCIFFCKNKNNYVLRLLAYLTMNKYFERVQIVFLVANHTKNTAERLFNLLKIDYRKENVFSLSELIQVCNQNEYVTAHKVNWKVFDNWNEYCDLYFDKLKATKKYQIFQAGNEPISMIEC